MTAGLENVADIYALAPMQAGMLYHSIAEPGSGVFVDQICCVLRGPLDVPRFRAAWARLVERHAILRTAFLWDGLDEPLQVVREQAELPWSEQDWRDLDEPDRGRRLDALLRDDRRRDFDLADAPLLRMTLAREATDRWRWLWTFHHLVLDGWSASVLLRELLATYDALATGATADLPPPAPYRDYIAWHAARDRDRASSYWRDYLRGFDTPTRLPAPAGAAPGRSGPRSHTVALTADATARLRAMAAGQRVTPSVVVQGAWALLLARWTRERDVVFGVTTSGRPPELEGIEGAVGLFINTLPLRATVDGDATIGDWLRGLHERQLRTREVEYSALATVQRESAVPPGAPLFESIVVFENYPAGADLRSEGLAIERLDFHEQSNFPLAVLVLPGAALELTFVSDGARFDDATIAVLADRLVLALERIIADPDATLGAIDLVTDDERRRLLREWNDTAAPFPADRLAHELFEDAARTQPDAVAVVDEERSLTYAALDRAANRLAHRLRDGGLRPDDRIGLSVDRSVDLAVGILGILKAGGAYVPIDPNYPEAHVARLLDEARPHAVVGRAARLASLPGAATRVPLEDDAPTSDHPDDGPPAIETTSENLAYVIFTSGSTGRPKGVMVTHRNLVHSTTARDRFYPGRVGRFLLLSSFSFDSSVAGIFWTLSTGGTLVLPAPQVEQDMDRLLALARAQAVTHLLGLPTLYGLMLAHAANGELDALETAIVAGEACPPDVVRRHFETLPRCGLWNEYGPTEATVWSVAHRLGPDDADADVPIGRPIPNTQAYVLDDAQRPVPIGFEGELYLGGAGLARGYLGDDELTRRQFPTVALSGAEPQRLYRTGDLVRHRADGALVFRGRADAQLKIRGHRIETTAVENALRGQASVGDAAVRGHAAAGGRVRLVGYVEPAAPGDATPDALRRALAATLPAFMVPDVIVVLPAIPRTANGKTDYRALPAPDAAAAPDAATAPPRTEAERILASIWSDLLGVDTIGVHDDFFQLGGDSILTIQVISRARQAGLDIAPRQVAEHPTIADLAAAAGRGAADGAATEPDDPTGDAPLTPIQHWFFERDLVAPHHWNQSMLFEVPADVDVDVLDEAWRACVAHHDALRARFERRAGAWRQRIADADDAPAALEIVEPDAGGDDASPWRRVVAEAQSTLDLARGPVARAVLVPGTGGAPARLALVVHHLVVDLVSWSILADDLELAYRQRRKGEPIALPAKTTSYRRWGQRLASLADDDRLREEAAFWRGVADTTVPNIPLGGGPEDGATEATARRVRVELDADRTRALLSDAHDAYRTRTVDFIAAALARALAGWTGHDRVRIELEHHGRADEIPGVDLSRTVGWFTATHPVVLATDADPGAAIKATKEALRRVPGHGLGFGVLRYLGKDATALAGAAAPVTLNYMGRVGQPSDAGLLRRVSDLQESARDPRNRRTHALEVLAAVRDDRLVVEWIYCASLHRRETIEGVASAFERALVDLVDHARGSEAGGFTPSDFPEADLDQEDLDRFMESLGE